MTTPANDGSGWARLVVPVVAVALVAVALNASWHAIQATLVAVDAPTELVIALPAILEPAALIYAWVTIDRARTGRDATTARRLLIIALVAAVAYNIASAVPLTDLLPAGSPGRIAVLAISAALAPLTVVSVGHTALVEYAAWRAARRSLVDDIHAALEAEAQQALTGQLRGEFAAEVHAAVLDRLRADMAGRLGLTAADPTSVPPLTTPRVADGTATGPGRDMSVVEPVTTSMIAVALDDVPPSARPVVVEHLAAGGRVTDAELTVAVSVACDVSDRTARRYLAQVRRASDH